MATIDTVPGGAADLAAIEQGVLLAVAVLVAVLLGATWWALTGSAMSEPG